MKKIGIIIIIFMIAITTLSCSINVCSIADNTLYKHIGPIDEWTGSIRIEGESNTIWKGSVTFSDSTISALNFSSGETEEYYIPYPSVLGALDEAATKGGFSYSVIYYPDWNAFFISTIDKDTASEKTGWNYWVDYVMPLVGANQYELTNEDNKILWGFLYFETWETEAHALKIIVNKEKVRKNEEFTTIVTDETDTPVEGAIVYIDSTTYTTDENGKVKNRIEKTGTYPIYAEKEPTADDTYLRSDKDSIQVKRFKLTSEFNIFEKYPFLKRIFQLPIFNKILSC